LKVCRAVRRQIFISGADFESGLRLNPKQNPEAFAQRQDGIKQYSEDEVAEIREKAVEYARHLKTLED
jgi:hypothetical protein